ncbi:MAG: SRPBCC family protein [Gemmatimonadetes bacterium]|nr:SRPBCC family protein [Gemmatimonadota bacterium]
MKWILVVLAALAALALLILIAGLFVPKSHEASVTVRLGKPPADVWAVITDFPKQPEWNSEITAVTALPDRDSKAVWQETFGGQFQATVVNAVVEPPARLVREILPGGPFHGSWTWDLAPDAQGTRLTITERGTVENPFFRGMMVFQDNTRTVREYAASLAKRLETELQTVP